MYNYNRPRTTSISRNTSYVGETIEQKINRILNNKEPIKDGAPVIYTDRKDGVKPEYNIRTDKWEVALDAMETVATSNLAKRDMSIGERTYDTMTEIQQQDFNKKYPNNKHNLTQKQKPDGGPVSTQGTNQ